MKRLIWIIILSFFCFFSSLGQSSGQSKGPPKKTPELLTQGKKLYEQNCVTCHGPKGMERANSVLLSSHLPQTSPNFLINGLLVKETSRKFLM